MRVIVKRTLREFWESIPKYLDAKGPLEAWHEEAMKAAWNTPHDIKAQYASAGIVGGDRVVFNIAGNKYRLVVAVDWQRRIVFVRFVGTHRQYDEIDVRSV